MQRERENGKFKKGSKWIKTPSARSKFFTEYNRKKWEKYRINKQADFEKNEIIQTTQPAASSTSEPVETPLDQDTFNQEPLVIAPIGDDHVSDNAYPFDNYGPEPLVITPNGHDDASDNSISQASNDTPLKLNTIPLKLNTVPLIGQGRPYIELDGNRIVNMKHLAKQLVCQQCLCILSLLNVIHENKCGLGSLLKVQCQSCKAIRNIETSQCLITNEKYSSNKDYAINRQCVLATKNADMKPVDVEKFFSALDVPPIEKSFFDKMQKSVDDNDIQTLEMSCEEVEVIHIEDEYD